MSVGAVTTSMAGTCDTISLPLPVILLLASFIFVIIILSFFLVYYRCKLNSTREALVRYVCIYLSVKDFVPSDKHPVVNRMKAPVTPEEFIQIINRMLKRMMLLPLFILTVLQLTGCSKDDPYNTSHSDKGAVQVTTDWASRSSDTVLPTDYILRIGSEEQTVQGETNAFKSLFLPGTQNLLVYHQTEGVTISGTTATVNTLEDGTLNPMPGFLFSASKELDIPKDDTLKVTVSMIQRIRTLVLTLKLNPGDEQRIAGTASTLTGIAPTMDLATGSVTATEGKLVAPVFTMGSDGGETRATGNPVLATSLRLLGVMPDEKQELTLVVTLTNGTMQTIVTDLTESLKNFGDKMEPLALDATLTLPDEEDPPEEVSATISDWKIVDNEDIDVN